MRISTVPKHILDKILEREKKDAYRPENIDLKVMLKNILSRANRFVPSEAGSILLDDPVLKRSGQSSGLLFFVACFGRGSSGVIGTTLPVDVGIAGRTYTTGMAYISKKVKYDSNFYPAIDKKTKYKTKSIICAPVMVKDSTVGVIELINKLESVNYTHNDLTLLKIFAEYTSTLIQNSLDAKRFGELSIKDNLTGLHNDRYVFDRLAKEVAKALAKKSDLSIVFLDLDRFKEINDNHGHLAGSRVLAEVGHLIIKCMGRTGAVCARYGGDEFTIILPGKTIEEAAEHAQRLKKEIEEYTYLNHKYHGFEKALKIKGVITGSLGVASLKANIQSKGTVKEISDALIRQADAAMYRSKEAGRNKVTISDEKIKTLSHRSAYSSK